MTMKYMDYVSLAKTTYTTIHSEATFIILLLPLFELQKDLWPNFETFHRAVHLISPEGLVELLFYSKRCGR